MSNPQYQFVLSGSGHQKLHVTATGRIRPDAASGDDGNWLTATVEIRTGRFSGAVMCSLRTDDLDGTLAELQEAGVEILADTRIDLPENHAKAVFISDPDGTLIELVEQPGD